MGRKATWFELLFDLAFVTAIASLSHHVDAGRPLQSTAESAFCILTFFLLWTQATFFSNRFDCDDVLQRLLFVVLMFGVLCMAAFAGGLTHETTSYYCLGLLLARGSLIASYLRVVWRGQSWLLVWQRLCQGYGVSATLTALAFVASIDVRLILLGSALLIDLSIPVLLRGSLSVLEDKLEAHHLPERFGLFVLLVMGEGIAAVAHGVGYRDGHANWFHAAEAFVIVLVMWSLYFDQRDDDVVNRGFADVLRWEYVHYVLITTVAVCSFSMHVILGESAEAFLWLSIFGASLAAYNLCLARIQHLCYQSLMRGLPRVVTLRVGAAVVYGLIAFSPFSPLIRWHAYVCFAIFQFCADKSLLRDHENAILRH